MGSHLHWPHVSFLPGKQQPIFSFQTAGKKKANHQTTGWSWCQPIEAFCMNTSYRMPLYSWRKKLAKILLSSVSQSTLILAWRTGLFPSPSICHFFELETELLIIWERCVKGVSWGNSALMTPCAFPAPDILCPDGIHYMETMETLIHPATGAKHRFKTQGWFMSSLTSQLRSPITREAQYFDQPIGRSLLFLVSHGPKHEATLYKLPAPKIYVSVAGISFINKAFSRTL